MSLVAFGNIAANSSGIAVLGIIKGVREIHRKFTCILRECLYIYTLFKNEEKNKTSLFVIAHTFSISKYVGDRHGAMSILRTISNRHYRTHSFPNLDCQTLYFFLKFGDVGFGFGSVFGFIGPEDFPPEL